jgi:methionyl-tRNA formyltransferase
MKILVIVDDEAEIITWVRWLINNLGHEIVQTPEEADLAVAPMLKRILTEEQLNGPKLGTLIFHPSLLPRHAGPDAIKWAFRQGEKYTGATWFWGEKMLDGGDICEQEVLEILPGETPRQFYQRAVIPSALQLLKYAINDISNGHIRRRPQRIEARTYEPSLALS